MELEKKLAQFNNQMNILKDHSILKKSKEQQKQIYLELKRKEEERKRKEEEEKKKLLDK